MGAEPLHCGMAVTAGAVETFAKDAVVSGNVSVDDTLAFVIDCVTAVLTDETQCMIVEISGDLKNFMLERICTLNAEPNSVSDTVDCIVGAVTSIKKLRVAPGTT